MPERVSSFWSTALRNFNDISVQNWNKIALNSGDHERIALSDF